MKRIVLLWVAFSIITGAAVAQEKKEAVKLYNPAANARADIDAAVARAKKAGKHVFVQVGGNWCGWCIAFHNLVDTTAALKKALNDNYETVLVNYSPENKNEAVLATLNYPQRFGFPVFVILDGNGKVLHTQNSAYLETDDVNASGKKKTGHDIKVVTNFLKGWTVAAVNPDTYGKGTK
ncbi:thioredoxin family protein [Pedobacter metabolipauper]|uniref:Thioredoxin-like protein n=1 Tax=Pedobacter metabolipauper TaxID=425513 RepID=A0A4R6SWD9_9SPHI|nr:thioredoxin family protein [Pedobacter metabolipauper]TDQ09699.1 thioredoxin-like protein [Pedobacter metabolipauper]